MAGYHPNSEAWGRAKDRFFSWREVALALVTPAVTVIVFLALGLANDAEAVAVAGGVALFVGLVFLPGTAFLGSRLTAHRRFVRGQLTEMSAAIMAGAADRQAEGPDLSAITATTTASQYPRLAVVADPAGRSRRLTGQDETGFVLLMAKFWITNESTAEGARVLTARIDNVVLEGSVATRSDVVGSFWSPPSGQPPLSIEKRATIEVRCQFSVRADVDSSGGCVNPKSVTGTVVFTDQFGHDHRSEPLTWQ
jgi:hypothetical protein